MAKNDYLRQSEGTRLKISDFSSGVLSNAIFMCGYECTKNQKCPFSENICDGPEKQMEKRREMGGHFYFAGTGK
jgi:hypothetical protein